MSEIERCRPWLEAAIRRSGDLNTWDEIEAGIRSGMMQLWPAPKGCFVTELIVYPRGKAVRAILAGGDLGQLMAMVPDMIVWARSQGCDFAEFDGRLGWKKPLQRQGWRQRSITMELDLGAGNGQQEQD